MWNKEPAQPTGEPPVRKELEADYNKAMVRMKMRGHGGECLRNVIAYQEQEIDMYRGEIVRLRNAIDGLQRKAEDTALVHGHTAEMIAEGIAIADGLPRISKDDTMILQSEYILGSEETIATMQEEIKKRTGINVALLDGRMKIAGVIEHGS